MREHLLTVERYLSEYAAGGAPGTSGRRRRERDRGVLRQPLDAGARGPRVRAVDRHQVAAELQVHPRTARRLLNRMVHDGWLMRRDGARPTYTPTMRIVALAAQLAQRAPLVATRSSRATTCTARTGDAVHLGDPELPVGAPPGPGPAPAMAVPAAARPRARQRDRRGQGAARVPGAVARGGARRAAGAGDRAHTGRAGGAPRRSRRARERGYAVEDEEFRVGLRALAVPSAATARWSLRSPVVAGPLAGRPARNVAAGSPRRAPSSPRGSPWSRCDGGGRSRSGGLRRGWPRSYDLFTGGHDHAAWARSARAPRAASTDLTGHRLLDVGCGTGSAPAADGRTRR